MGRNFSVVFALGNGVITLSGGEIGDAGQRAAALEDDLGFARPIEADDAQRSPEIADEHAPGLAVVRDADSLLEAGKQDFGIDELAVPDRCSVQRIATGRIAAVRPVQCTGPAIRSLPLTPR